MRGKILLVVGVGVGYVLGTRAGREKYDQMKAAVSKFWNDPRVQQKVDLAEDFMKDKAPDVAEFLSDSAKKVASQVLAERGEHEARLVQLHDRRQVGVLRRSRDPGRLQRPIGGLVEGVAGPRALLGEEDQVPGGNRFPRDCPRGPEGEGGGEEQGDREEQDLQPGHGSLGGRGTS